MKVCHFSDWHTSFQRLPAADLYICTGDMLPNFPILRVLTNKWNRTNTVDWDPNGSDPRPFGYITGRKFDPEREKQKQDGWIVFYGNLRKLLGNPEAPVVCVRGNHDFTNLAQMFAGGPVWEVDEDPTRTFEFRGYKIGGCRGIPYIMGEWSDELYEDQFTYAVEKIPGDIDILVTHSPPHGQLDRWCGDNLGSPALRKYIERRALNAAFRNEPPLRLHAFGHIHETNGQHQANGTLFSNAATTTLVHELEDR